MRTRGIRGYEVQASLSSSSIARGMVWTSRSSIGRGSALAEAFLSGTESDEIVGDAGGIFERCLRLADKLG